MFISVLIGIHRFGNLEHEAGWVSGGRTCSVLLRAVPESNDYQIYEAKLCGIINLTVKYSKYTKAPQRSSNIAARTLMVKTMALEGKASASEEKYQLHCPWEM